MSSKDCFPGVNIAGGVNYFLWDRDYTGDCIIKNCSNDNQEIVATRPLNEFGVFIRDNRAINIIHKFIESEDESLSNHTFTRNPFGFVSKERGESSPIKDCENVKLISSGGIGYIRRQAVEKNIQEIEHAIMIYDSAIKTGNDELDVLLEIKDLLKNKESK